MKKLLLFSLLVLVAASCHKKVEETKKQGKYDVAIREHAEENPDGFAFDLSGNGKLLEQGYVFASEDGPGNNSVDMAVEKALSQDGVVAGWTGCDGNTIFQSVKVIDSYDDAVAYAKKNDIQMMYDLKAKLPVYNTPSAEPQDGAKASHGAVTIEFKKGANGRNGYYFVTIDFRTADKKTIGKDYAKCVNKLDVWYVERVFAYLTGSLWVENIWSIDAVWRLANIQPTLHQEYKDLIDGFASELYYCPLIDNDLLMYLANLLPDVLRPTSCSAYGVMPEMSETGQTLVHRNLDWPDIAMPWPFPKGRNGIVAPMQSVTKMILPDRVVYSFGLLGLFNAITAIDATNGNMVGILDSGVKGNYSSKGKRSYVFDLMHALCNSTTTDQIAAEMTKSENKYAFNHLILLADKKQVRVVENNMLEPARAKRAVRSSDSELARFVNPQWKVPNTIGVVNCFMLKGQINNFDSASGKTINVLRWKQQIAQTDAALAKKTDKKLNMQDVRNIECFYDGNLKSDWYNNLYNNYTFQMIEYVPGENKASVFFKPFDASVPADPKSMFIDIPLDKN